MAGLKDIAKKVGLSPLRLEDGKNVNLMDLLEEMFKAIVDECREKGGSVRIKDFGTFTARMNKGRKLKTPLMEDGEVEFGDILLLKFHQSTVSKKQLNEGGAVEAWGGKYIEKKLRPSDIKKAEAAQKKKDETAKKKTKSKKETPENTDEKKSEMTEKKTKKAATKKSPTSKKENESAAPKAKKPVKKAPVSKKSKKSKKE